MHTPKLRSIPVLINYCSATQIIPSLGRATIVIATATSSRITRRFMTSWRARIFEFCLSVSTHSDWSIKGFHGLLFYPLDWNHHVTFLNVRICTVNWKRCAIKFWIYLKIQRKLSYLVSLEVETKARCRRETWSYPKFVTNSNSDLFSVAFLDLYSYTN